MIIAKDENTVEQLMTQLGVDQCLVNQDISV